MGARVLFIIGYPTVVLVLITVVAAVLLGIGTALTFLFAVSVWEATVVVLVVTAGAFWIHFQGPLHNHPEVYPDVDPAEDSLPHVTVADFVIQPGRRSRRRRR